MLSKGVSETLSKVQSAGKSRFDGLSRALHAESMAKPVASFLQSRPRLRSSFDRFVKAVQAGLEETRAAPAKEKAGDKGVSGKTGEILERNNSGESASAN